MSLEHATRILDILLEVKVRNPMWVQRRFRTKFIQTGSSRIPVDPFRLIVGGQVLVAAKYDWPILFNTTTYVVGH